jgi:hypothetical protein
MKEFLLMFYSPYSKMITSESPVFNMGRGAYDTTGIEKPPKPKPK